MFEWLKNMFNGKNDPADNLVDQSQEDLTVDDDMTSKYAKGSPADNELDGRESHNDDDGD